MPVHDRKKSNRLHLVPELYRLRIRFFTTIHKWYHCIEHKTQVLTSCDRLFQPAKFDVKFGEAIWFGFRNRILSKSPNPWVCTNSFFPVTLEISDNKNVIVNIRTCTEISESKKINGIKATFLIVRQL